MVVSRIQKRHRSDEDYIGSDYCFEIWIRDSDVVELFRTKYLSYVIFVQVTHCHGVPLLYMYIGWI
jgi:hypothetical protein